MKKFIDPYIKNKSKKSNEVFQFFPGTNLPLPSEIEISESGTCNRKCSFCPRSAEDFKDIKNGINILDLLSKNNITHSKSEARRLILNSGLKINNELLSDEKKNIKEIDFKEKILKISLGKKKHYLFKIN